MARIFCQHNREHTSISEAKFCPGHQVKPAPKPPTREQLDYVKLLGGDAWTARNLSRSQVSAYIDHLKAKRTSSAKTGAPVPDKSFAAQNDRVNMCLGMIRDGRYAVSPDDVTPLTFVRIVRPKTGNYKGAVKVQTQHGDDLVDRLFLWPSGKVTIKAPFIVESLLLIAADLRGASIRYGQEIGQCCICGKSLTDERSRYYGIGPDCETRFGDIIAEVDQNSGPYRPGLSWERGVSR
jgi:hypothetical protein